MSLVSRYEVHILYIHVHTVRIILCVCLLFTKHLTLLLHILYVQYIKVHNVHSQCVVHTLHQVLHNSVQYIGLYRIVRYTGCMYVGSDVSLYCGCCFLRFRIPQLLTGLVKSERVLNVLLYISKAHPQAVYFPIRTLYLTLKMEQKKSEYRVRGTVHVYHF